MRKSWVILAILLGVPAVVSRAQTFQVLRESDAYYRFNPNLSVDFQAKDTREGGEPTSAEIGPSLDFHVKWLQKLVEITTYDLDKSKSHLLLFSVGYRYLPYPSAPPTNRFEPYVAIHIPTKGKLLVSDRNRPISTGRRAAFRGTTETR